MAERAARYDGEQLKGSLNLWIDLKILYRQGLKEEYFLSFDSALISLCTHFSRTQMQALQDRKIRDLEIMLEGSKTNVKSTQDMYRQQVSSFNAEMDELQRQLVRPGGHPGVLVRGCDAFSMLYESMNFVSSCGVQSRHPGVCGNKASFDAKQCLNIKV